MRELILDHIHVVGIRMIMHQINLRTRQLVCPRRCMILLVLSGRKHLEWKFKVYLVKYIFEKSSQSLLGLLGI
jgi:hypothetical protein